jgi:nucleotide-binding universal stress UspA family protein
MSESFSSSSPFSSSASSRVIASPDASPDAVTASIQHILFPTDFSVASMHALPYVAGMAAKLGASVCLCHLIMLNLLAGGAPEAAPYLYDAARKQGEEELAALAGSAKLQRFRPKTLLVSGTVENELPAIVRDHRIDLIVAGTHGRTGLRRLLLGSVVEEICRVATCPVLTVGPGLLLENSTDFRRILFPTDLSETSRRIVPYLGRIAQEYSAEVTVLHVLPEDLETNPDARTLAEPIRARMMQMFEKELAAFKPEYVIGFGDTAQTILRIAKERASDLIAMGIRNSFLPEIQLRSSTAYRIMAGSNCPVLTCR